MWIFNNDSFVSVVEDWADSSMVYVRARRQIDIINFVGDLDIPYEIKHTPKNDYHYRIHLSKNMLSKVLLDQASRIDYSNFKDSIDDNDLHHFAAETWNSGYRNLAERAGRLY